MIKTIFTGSYREEDVEFLLKPIHVPDTPIEEKERRIQLENRHYSEMLSHESLPSEQYLSLFHQALQQNKQQMAEDCLRLATMIVEQRSDDIVLVSLARAGTPIGVILKHTLSERYNGNVYHYSVSIIRDRGIDENALNYILARHADTSLVFIDGWTGKGVIARELKTTINDFNQQHQTKIDAGLYVLADLAGVASVAASGEDYLIPSSILNATISGLISRSVLNSDYTTKNEFHGCVYYQQFEKADISQWFVQEILDTIKNIGQLLPPQNLNKMALQQQSRQFLENIKQTYGIYDENRVKPGIGEATRVLLRRVPDLLLLRESNDKSVQHLKVLAEEKQVNIIYQQDLPYSATALIKEITH